jgi:uncharacterized protein
MEFTMAALPAVAACFSHEPVRPCRTARTRPFGPPTGAELNQAILRLRTAATMLLALALPGAAMGQIRLPQPVGYVNDFASIIAPETEAQIGRVIDEVRVKSGGEIVVVTLNSLEGRTIDEVALQIGREWRIGRKGDPGDAARNTGLVVLVVPKESSPDGRGPLKIETGLGTSTFLTAGEAGAIADRYMIPSFREGDYATGILTGVAALAHEYAGRFGFELTGDVPALPEPAQGRRDGGGGGGGLVFIIIIAFVIAMIAGRGGRGGGGGRRGRRGSAADLALLAMLLGGRRGGRGGGFGGGGGVGGGVAGRSC